MVAPTGFETRVSHDHVFAKYLIKFRDINHQNTGVTKTRGGFDHTAQSEGPSPAEVASMLG